MLQEEHLKGHQRTFNIYEQQTKDQNKKSKKNKNQKEKKIANQKFFQKKNKQKCIEGRISDRKNEENPVKSSGDKDKAEAKCLHAFAASSNSPRNFHTKKLQRAHRLICDYVWT